MEKKAKRHICNLCHKEFTQKGSLQTHYLIHTGKRPHVCTVCNNSFTDKSTLRKHSLIHTGKKPFVCDICQKGFVQKITLKKHYLVHTGERNNICEICNKGFGQKSSLLTHYRVHSKNREYKNLRKLLPKNNNAKMTIEGDDTTPDQKQQQVQGENRIVEPSFAYVTQFSNLMNYYGTDQEKFQKINNEMNDDDSTPKLRHLLLGSGNQGDNIIQEDLNKLSPSSKNISPMTLDKNSSGLPPYDNTTIKLEIDVESDIEEQTNSLLGNSTNTEESPFLQLNEQSCENNSDGTGELYPINNKQSSSSSDEELSVLKALQAVTVALRDTNTKVLSADDNFGNYVGSVLASIPDSLNKENAKMKIMELLTKLQYGS